MCGICGILNLNSGQKVEEAQLRTMGDEMRHRGPDGEGYFLDENVGLGHKRLSIIDLSDHARQPMTNEDFRYWIVFNGEIYNYIELRESLQTLGHQFRSHSDTEVILHLFEENGPDCVNKLNGMFSFVIWDKKERSLFAARDRFGIKPFYYHFTKRLFVFASEIKALLKTKLFPTQLCHEALSDYLTFQFCLGDKTLFEQVRKLLPGHRLTLSSSGDMRIEKYWDLDFTVDTHHTEEYFEMKLLELLKDSIRLQLRADVDVGAHLSGGLDSSTVVCLASAVRTSQIHTFSGGFKESTQYDETSYAREVSKATRSIHHEVFPTARDFVDIMPRLIYQMDEPVAGPGLFPQYYVSQLASQQVKVVLGGQGGDEVFGGYIRYFIAYLEECLRGGIEGSQIDQKEQKYIVTLESMLPHLSQLKGYAPLLQRFWKKGLFEATNNRYFTLIDRSGDIEDLVNPGMLNVGGRYSPFDEYLKVFTSGNTKSYINRMTHFDLKTLLPALLQVEDRTSMAVSLESRVPLLDHRIVELVTSMPPMIKYQGGRSKQILRKVVRDIVPPLISARKDKMGFPVPLNEWCRSGIVREFVKQVLLDRETASRQVFHEDKIETLLDSERPYGRGIWGLLSLSLWFRAYGVSA